MPVTNLFPGPELKAWERDKVINYAKYVRGHGQPRSYKMAMTDSAKISGSDAFHPKTCLLSRTFPLHALLGVTELPKVYPQNAWPSCKLWADCIPPCF